MANDGPNLVDESSPDDEQGGSTFVLSNDPVVLEQERHSDSLSDYENLGELPHSYGDAFLFAIARDPHSIYAYWDTDWAPLFGDMPPADQKVCLRVLWHEGIEESKAFVEPMAGSHLLTVAHARSSYRIELGYYAPENVWNSVATSSAVITPPEEAAAERESVDVATIPFHLSFQRIVDAFRGSRYDGDALAEIIGHLQHHADSSDATLPEEERELLRALETARPEADSTQRARLRSAPDVFASRERVESILGFGATSPM
ncbi:MAG TPA: DUF4912 domain-containing protein [Chthoniobacterales bacterium]|nr:DUF4912 domain-containing protein [Chthoniobacterales bacterium]